MLYAFEVTTKARIETLLRNLDVESADGWNAKARAYEWLKIAKEAMDAAMNQPDY